MNPIISVLMPVYNAEKYLREAIESILAQTLTDFEFLIINDGSTDGSASIVRSYIDPRIRFIENEKNLGITPTLNKGIQLASCELIARMDADDISHPERLEKQYKFLQQTPDCALIASWVRRISNEGEFEKVLGQDPAHYFYTLLFTPAGFFHPTAIFKKSAVMEVGLYSKTYAEDFNLWCKMRKNFRFHVISEALLDYRSSETSLWRVSKKKEYEEAHDEQIIENVSYYTGNKFQLNAYEVKFLRGSMEALLALNDKKAILKSFQKLDVITSCFLAHKNTKHENLQQLREVAFKYKMQLLEKLGKKLKPQDVLELLIRMRDWRLLFSFVSKKLGKRRKSIRKSFAGANDRPSLQIKTNI